MKKTFEIPWGRSTLPWQTSLSLVHPSADPDKTPARPPSAALDEPLGSPPLEDLAEGARRVAVVLPDATRAWQEIPLMVEAVAKRLRRARCGKIEWILGLGQHRPSTEEEMAHIVGPFAGPDDAVFCHDASATDDLGRRTSRGTVLSVQPEVADADLVVFVGGICYHDLAGFSGGRKALLPGVSARTSIQANHRLGMTDRGFNPCVASGVLEGNPVHEDMAEYLDLFLQGRRAFLLNVVPDGKGRPYDYVAGDPVRAWRKGVERAVELQTLWAERECDAAVVSSGGYPYDIDLYQATKALASVYGALCPRGGIVLVADLEEGMGTDVFDRTMRLALVDFEGAMEALRRDFTIPAYIAVKIAWELSTRPAALVTSAGDRVAFPGLVTDDMEAALAHATGGVAPGATLFVPSGNTVLVRKRQAPQQSR
ncbi:lactate racemase domain-containing protein [Aminirod propionatiphilus]|uniref:DUF2088 domain-containing protein n=1 Tax=Aminirod propionatiphilus TaxID=3415223 RepID=A0ACD1DUE5_9BACT|nr:DUF2088 domain-containing protein [Synergistota bacterium]